MSQITIILQIKTDLPTVAALCLNMLGEGADPTATRTIDFFKRNSSELQDGYIRVAVEDYLIPPLEQMFVAVGGETPDVKLITVEHGGQTRFVTGVDIDGNEQVLGCVGMIPIDAESWETI